jgi:hypothetical protein
LDVKNLKKKKKYKIALKKVKKELSFNLLINKNFFFFFNFFFNFFLKLTRKLQNLFLKKKNKIFFFKSNLKINFFNFLKKKTEFKKIIKLKRLNSFFFKKLNIMTLKMFLSMFNKKLTKKNYQSTQLNYIKKLKLSLKKKVFIKKKKITLKVSSFFFKKLIQKNYKKNKFFTYKKVFKLKKKQANLQFSKFLGYTKIKSKKINAFLISLEKKSFFSANLALNSSLFFVLKTFFFFLNEQLFSFLIKKKYISLNFSHVQTEALCLASGDFFQFLKTKNIVTFFSFWIKKQKKYFKQLKKKLFFLKKKKKKNPLNFRLQSFNKLYTKILSFNKKIKKNTEFDYLTLSFFFLNTTPRTIVQYKNFNPFLYKLLQFK